MVAIAAFTSIILSGPLFPASGKDLAFSGSLEKLTPDAISVRLLDGRIIEARLPKTGALSAGRLSDGRHVGDLVDIACAIIAPSYDKQAKLFRYLELRRLEVLRGNPSPEDLERALTSRVWREPGNLLKPPPQVSGDSGVQLRLRPSGRAGLAPSVLPLQVPRQVYPGEEPGNLLERARGVNLAYARSLPNFIVDETVTRQVRRAGNSEWRLADNFVSEVRIQASQETRQNIVKDGKPWTQPFAAIPGFRWFLGFGAELNPLFSPGCLVTFESQGPEPTPGRQAWGYQYEAPADGCFGWYDSGYQRYFPAFSGRIIVDGATGRLVRFEQKALGFPQAFPDRQAEKIVVWDDIEIGGSSYLLPVSATYLTEFSDGDAWWVKVQYRNHRHFEASSNITFR